MEPSGKFTPFLQTTTEDRSGKSRISPPPGRTYAQSDAQLVLLHVAIRRLNVEQHVHYLDICSLVKGEYPKTPWAWEVARYERAGIENIYDHHDVTDEYEDGARLISNCRQQAGWEMENSGRGKRAVAAGPISMNRK